MKKNDGALIIPYWAKWMLGIVLTIVIGVFTNELNKNHSQVIKNTENINNVKEDVKEIKQDGKNQNRMLIQLLSANGIVPDTTVTYKKLPCKKSPFEIAQLKPKQPRN